MTIYGPSPSIGRASLCSFNVKGLHAIDVSTVLDQSGDMCLQELLGDLDTIPIAPSFAGQWIDLLIVAHVLSHLPTTGSHLLLSFAHRHLCSLP